MMGDFNLVEDAIDHIPCKLDNVLTTDILRDFKIKYNLIDGWRRANPLTKGYVWSRESDGTQSRIDRTYAHEDILNNCTKWAIDPAPLPTDHNLISATVSTLTSPEIGKGRWAIPIHLIKNREVKKEIQCLAHSLQREIENIQLRSPQKTPKYY